MINLGLRSKYGIRHGEELRKKRRTHARSMADIEAERSMAELERSEQGATRRKGMEEVGLGERLGREQEFARPLQRSEIGKRGTETEKLGAEAAEIRYGTEFERGSRSTIEDILKARGGLAKAEAEEAGLGLLEIRRKQDLRSKAEAEAEARIEPKVKKEVEAAKPERKLRSSIKKALWSGYDTRFGIHTPGFGAPLKGWADIGGLLGAGIKKGYEYAFPRGK